MQAPVHFHKIFSPEAVHSYTDNVRCCGRDPSIGPVYHAEITQHHKGSSSFVDAHRGMPSLPSIFMACSRRTETTRNYYRLLHLHSLPNYLYGIWFVRFCAQNRPHLICPKHLSFKAIASTFTSKLGASLSSITPSLHSSWFTCGRS